MTTNTKTYAWAAIVIALFCVIVGLVIHYSRSGMETRTITLTTSPEMGIAAPANTSFVRRFDTPNDTFASVLNAVNDGDAEALIAGFDHPNPEQEKSLRDVAGGMAVGKKIRAAAAARFGQAEALRLVRNLGFVPPVNFSALAQLPPAMDGDTAQLTLPRLGTFQFVRLDGLWRMNPDVLAANQSPIEFFGRINGDAAEFEQVIAGINAGQYQSIAEVQAQLRRIFARIRGGEPAGDPPDRPAVLGPQQTPLKTIAAYYWAETTGDQAAALACWNNPSADQQTNIRQEVEAYNAGEQIRSAIAARFGKAIARDSILTLGLDPGFTREMLQSLHDKSGGGDKVEVNLQRLGVTLQLSKSDGTWRIDPDPQGATPAALAWSQRVHEHYLPQWLQLAADVKAGKYATIDQLKAAVDAIHHEMTAKHPQTIPAIPAK